LKIANRTLDRVLRGVGGRISSRREAELPDEGGRRGGARVAFALAVTLTTGCGAACTTSSRSDAASPAPQASVTWMTEFCTLVGELRSSLWSSANGGTGALRPRLESQLDAASKALTTTVSQLEALPEVPPSGGSTAVSILVGKLSDLHDETVVERKTLTALPPEATGADAGRVMETIWPKVASVGR
jgi:hypothetical protein